MDLKRGKIFYVDAETKKIIEIGDCHITSEYPVDDVHFDLRGYSQPSRIPEYNGKIEFSEKTRNLTVLNLLAACNIKCSNNYLKMHGGVIRRKKTRK